MNSRIAALPLRSKPAAYLELTKPDVSVLVVLTTLAGFWMASRSSPDWLLLSHTLFGTLLISAGTSALNHYLERESDAKMRRTARRPLPLGELRPNQALAFGIVLSVSGTLYLLSFVNALAGVLGAATCVSYLGLYTPLKQRTTLATLVGAFPGAAPPLIGWAAARGTLDSGAWVLYGILFCWQFPHFLSIAWMYREDYARAGIRMLPAVERTGRSTFRQIIWFSVAAFVLGLLPFLMKMAGTIYVTGAVVLGAGLIQFACQAARTRTNRHARYLMHATVAHIALLYGLMMFDRISG